jgi:hypothetical protein
MRVTILAQRFIPVIECILAFSSCSPKHTINPQATKGQQSVRVPMKTEIIDGWAPRLTPEIKRYSIADTSIISLNNDSAHSSSIQTTAIYDIALTALDDSFLLTARVESLTTNSRIQEAHVSGKIDSLEQFHATISSTGRSSLIIGSLPSVCAGGINPVATRILELTLNYPQRHLKIGDKWSDTVAIISCRGKTPLLQQNIYQYELTDFTKSTQLSLAKIQRTVTTTFHGVSTDLRNQLIVHGSGFNSSTLYVDQKNGMLVESTEHSQLLLLLTTTRGTYPFTQNIFTHITVQ